MKAKKLIQTMTLILCVICLLLPADTLASSSKKKTTLTVSYGVNDYLGLPLFEREHPDVKINIDYVHPINTEVVKQFLFRDPYFDVFRLPSNVGIFRQLKPKWSAPSLCTNL
jgi:ABC-type glycerol-3-phosphate transport system substrate-binding protein